MVRLILRSAPGGRRSAPGGSPLRDPPTLRWRYGGVVDFLMVRLILPALRSGRAPLRDPTLRCATDQSSIRWWRMRATSAIVPDIDG